MTVLSTVDTFMDSMVTVIEAIDPYIGQVFKTSKIWKSTGDFEADVKTTIAGAGLLDDAGRIGTDVSRYWVLSPSSTPTHFTTGSYEFENVITITGFFLRQSDDSQEEALNEAVRQILGKLLEDGVQLTTFDTGPGYMGYLDRPPRQIAGVQPATLGESGIKGHAVILEVRYYEEIDRN